VEDLDCPSNGSRIKREERGKKREKKEKKKKEKRGGRETGEGVANPERISGVPPAGRGEKKKTISISQESRIGKGRQERGGSERRAGQRLGEKNGKRVACRWGGVFSGEKAKGRRPRERGSSSEWQVFKSGAPGEKENKKVWEKKPPEKEGEKGHDLNHPPAGPRSEGGRARRASAKSVVPRQS